MVNEERKFEVNPLTAPIVLELFTRYANGETITEIGEAIKKRAIFSNSKFKYTKNSSMHRLFTNRRYLGEYRYGDIVTPGGMPAIVPQDILTEFKRALMKTNKSLRHKRLKLNTS